MGIFSDPKVTGAGGAVIGLLVGLFVGNDTLDEDVTRLVREEIAPVNAAAKDQGSTLEALSARLDALDAAVADGAAATGALAASVGDKIEGLRDTLGGTISDTASSQAEALKAALAEMSASVEGWTRSALEPASPPETAVIENTAQAAASSVAAGDAGPVVGVGETALFADGGVRAFVSRVTGETAVVSINGAASTIAAGNAVVVRYADGSCRVGVAQVSGDGAVITSDCDAPVAAGDGTAGAPGEVVMLADGALRVFVSGVVNGNARLAVNGLSTQVVAVGDAATVDVAGTSCTVSVTGIRGDMVGLTGSCG